MTPRFKPESLLNDDPTANGKDSQAVIKTKAFELEKGVPYSSSDCNSPEWATDSICQGAVHSGDGRR